MKNQQIKKHLKDAIDAAPINMLDAILAVPVKKMKEHDYITRQAVAKKQNFVNNRFMIPVCACAIIFLVAFTGWFTQFKVIDSTIFLDVNPGIEIELNKKDQVIALHAINDEAKQIINGIDYKSNSIESVSSQLILALQQQNYINEIHHTILLSVKNKYITKENEIKNRINKQIITILSQSNIQPNILRQSLQEDRLNHDLAKQYGVSNGKMAFMRNLISLDNSLSLEQLSNLSMDELLQLAQSKNLNLHKVVEYEDDDDDNEDDKDSDDDDEIEDIEDDDSNDDKKHHQTNGSISVSSGIIDHTDNETIDADGDDHQDNDHELQSQDESSSSDFEQDDTDSLEDDDSDFNSTDDDSNSETEDNI